VRGLAVIHSQTEGCACPKVDVRSAVDRSLCNWTLNGNTWIHLLRFQVSYSTIVANSKFATVTRLTVYPLLK